MDFYEKKRLVWKRDRQKLGALLKLHNYRCHYCDLPVMRLKEIRDAGYKIIKCHNDFILFKINEVTFQFPTATTDHINFLGNLDSDSPSKLENLVLACGWCNVRKGRRSKPYITHVPVPDLKPKKIS